MPKPKVNKIYLFALPLAFNNLANQYPIKGINDHKKTITTEKNIAESEMFN